MTDLEKERAQQAEQAARAARMQDKILGHLEDKLDEGTINATELKTAVDLLRANGWDWNSANLTKSLGEKLTKHVKFDDDLEDDRASFSH